MLQRPREPNRLLQLARRVHRLAVVPALAFLLPSTCFGCRAPLGRFQRLGACLRCWSGFRFLRGPVCSGCGLPAAESSDLLGPARGRCAACLLVRPAPDTVRALLAYDDHARRFLLRAKLSGRPELLREMGLQLAVAIERWRLHLGCTLLVPVPSHPWVNLRRGFAPADELARPVARRLGVHLDARILGRRTRSPLALKRMGATDRRSGVRRWFFVRVPLDGARVLLVDDVMTTGATARACARELKAAGATEVRVAVWGRRLPGGPV